MIVLRSVRMDDLDALWSLIAQATYGLTTLQVSKQQLSERLELSNFAFHRHAEKPSGEPYVFVLEDQSHDKLIGVSSIFSKTGGYEPFYSYRRVMKTHYCKLLDRTQVVETLQLIKIHDGPTEIGSLYLDDRFRGQGRGRLLSLGRFTFMAAHRNRFAEQVIAELRGVMTTDGVCPFWEGLGRHFFQMDFPNADNLSTSSKQFIEDWFPKHPIYVSLLPLSARDAMGCVHEQSKPAFALLQAEGFTQTDMIDIFDAGPTVICETNKIGAVRRTKRFVVAEISPGPKQSPSKRTSAAPQVSVESDQAIVASDNDGFRATLATVEPLGPASGGDPVRISESTATALNVEVGQPISVTPLYPSKNSKPR